MENLQDFFVYLQNENIANMNLKTIINDYSFFVISNEFDLNQKQIINKNINESKVIVINKFIVTSKKINDKYLIIGFNKTIIIIKPQFLSIFQDIFSSNPDIIFIYLSDSKELFSKNIQISNKQCEIDNVFIEEIKNFNQKLTIYSFKQMFESSIIQLWNCCLPCITGYLIKQGYFQLENEKTFDFSSISNKNVIDKKFKEFECINLRDIGSGASFTVILIYNIKDNKMYAIKKPLNNNFDVSNLNREIQNYKIINYPFLPKFYGTIEKNNYIVIDYINGQTLMQIKSLHLNEKEKYTIIMELMMTINYLHNNDLVYRDLKPDNIIIDKNTRVFLVDFDKMVRLSDVTSDGDNTKDFGLFFSAPELKDGIISFKNDIYSLGRMIWFIMNEEFPTNLNDSTNIIMNSEIQKIYNICTNKNLDKRPFIFELMLEFYVNFNAQMDISLINKDPFVQFIQDFSHYKSEYDSYNTKLIFKCFILSEYKDDPNSQFLLGFHYLKWFNVPQNIKKGIRYLSLSANHNYSLAQFELGKIYLDGKYIQQNINESIKNLSNAAEQNMSEAQYILGLIYIENKYVSRNISKSIYYFGQAANQNNPKAHYNLGVIYFEGKYVDRDINQAIHHFKIAADKNVLEAQINLGSIYYEGQYVTQDIDKAIEYLELAAQNNSPEAQYMLGCIYYKGEFVTKDINESIKFFTLAANLCYCQAQYLLGCIYYENIYVERDINKCIFYLTLAANQNHLNAQFKLGSIYFKGEFIQRDMNKAIGYLSSAANQNHLFAQRDLGSIYYEGKFVCKDINKAFNYFSKAADQNDTISQFNLGNIYFEGQYVQKDDSKALYYFRLAAEKNLPQAQTMVGICLLNTNHKESIDYLSKAANQNEPYALYNLGCIYYEGKYVLKDINKAFIFFKQAADQKIPEAQHNIAFFYLKGINVTKNIEKAFHYFQLASNQDYSPSQYNLSLFYLNGIFESRNPNKALFYLKLSSEKYHYSNFILGYLYQVGIYINKNIEKSIRYYRNASTFNIQYAKNNLGIIYKNGDIEGHLQPNIGKSIAYFEDAYNLNNDKLAMYNLAHIYIYSYKTNDKLDFAISLLIKSLNKDFEPAKDLLCIALFKKHELNLDAIKIELCNQNNLTNESVTSILQLINNHKMEEYYEFLRSIDYSYDFNREIILSKNIKIKKSNISKITNISSLFYEGFGI